MGVISTVFVGPNLFGHCAMRKRPFFRKHIRGVAQPGSALAWGASGRQFKSARPDIDKGVPPLAVGFLFPHNISQCLFTRGVSRRFTCAKRRYLRIYYMPIF